MVSRVYHVTVWRETNILFQGGMRRIYLYQCDMKQTCIIPVQRETNIYYTSAPRDEYILYQCSKSQIYVLYDTSGVRDEYTELGTRIIILVNASPRPLIVCVNIRTLGAFWLVLRTPMRTALARLVAGSKLVSWNTGAPASPTFFYQTFCPLSSFYQDCVDSDPGQIDFVTKNTE